MRKGWVVMDIGDTILGDSVYETREQAQDVIDGLDYFGHLLEVREIDVNTDSLTEKGEELMEELKELLKTAKHLHMSKGPEWFSMSPDERVQMMINILTSEGELVENLDDL